MENKLFDSDEIVGSWAPILETKGITDPDIRRKIALYCHHHSIDEQNLNQSTDSILQTPEAKTVSLLPLCIKILSKMENLKDVAIGYTSESIITEKKFISTDISRETIQDISALNPGMIDTIEDELALLAAKKIDDEIKILISINPGKTIVMYTNVLVGSIQTITEGTMSPRLSLVLNYGFKAMKDLFKADESDGLDRITTGINIPKLKKQLRNTGPGDVAINNIIIETLNRYLGLTSSNYSIIGGMETAHPMALLFLQELGILEDK